MKIIIAPDSFKGSLSAKALCTAMTQGVKRVLPNAIISEFPLADGGEGTMENLVFATKGNTYEVTVLDPFHRPIKARYGILGDGKTVIIEMAEASGLMRLKSTERNPVKATSFGTGQLILAALDKGYRKFIIGLGGSATNDGGMGMLKAFGIKINDQEGRLIIEEEVTSLKDIASFDTRNMDSRLKEAEFTIASDVDNFLCGCNGASIIFGPQKGATPDMIQILEKSLLNYGSTIEAQYGIDILNIPGAGAAGGMGAALIAFLNADIKSGIELTLDYLNIDQELNDADLIITGEGKLDAQTLSGKVIAGISKLGKEKNVPVIAICGANELTAKQMDTLGLLSAYSIVPGPCSLKEAIEQTGVWTSNCIEQIMRLKYLKTSEE